MTLTLKVWVCVIEQRYHLNDRPWFCMDHQDKECGYRQIVSAGARVIRKVDGTWPHAFVKAARGSVGNIPWRGAELILDSLAETPQEAL